MNQESDTEEEIDLYSEEGQYEEEVHRLLKKIADENDTDYEPKKKKIKEETEQPVRKSARQAKRKIQEEEKDKKKLLPKERKKKPTEEATTKREVIRGRQKATKSPLETVTLEQFIFNQREKMISWLEATLPQSKHEGLFNLREATVTDWINQFKTLIIPMAESGRMDAVMKGIMMKAGITDIDFGVDKDQRAKNMEILKVFLETFCKIVKEIPLETPTPTQIK